MAPLGIASDTFPVVAVYVSLVDKTLCGCVVGLVHFHRGLDLCALLRTRRGNGPAQSSCHRVEYGSHSRVCLVVGPPLQNRAKAPPALGSVGKLHNRVSRAEIYACVKDADLIHCLLYLEKILRRIIPLPSSLWLDAFEYYHSYFSWDSVVQR